MVNGVACTSEHTKPMAIAAANMKNERIGSAKDHGWYSVIAYIEARMVENLT